jgi:hypothetical protein
MTMDPHWREPNLFDAAEARRLQAQGIASVSSFPADEWVHKARAWAVDHAHRTGEVTSDDVHQFCPLPPGIHHNAMGAVFSGTQSLVACGMKKSERPSSHARRILIYKIRS